MQIVGQKVDVKVSEDFWVSAYATKIFEGQFYVIYSLELPCRVVVPRCAVQGEKVILPGIISNWVMEQLRQVQLPFSSALFDA